MADTKENDLAADWVELMGHLKMVAKTARKWVFWKVVYSVVQLAKSILAYLDDLMVGWMGG